LTNSEILQAAFRAVRKGKGQALKRYFRSVYHLQSQEVDEQLELTMSNLRRYFEDRNIQACDIEFD